MISEFVITIGCHFLSSLGTERVNQIYVAYSPATSRDIP